MKTETQHTAGPYSISGIPGDNYIMAFSPTLRRKTSIAIVLGWPGITDEEFQANKALLASAPTLLAQRDELLAMLGDIAFQLGRLTGENLEVYARTASVLAGTAIAACNAGGKNGGK